MSASTKLPPIPLRGASRSVGSQKVPSKRILIVDDSATVQFMQRMILSSEPYEIISAGTAEEGIEMAQAMSPDLILMDVVMPGMTGIEAVRKLRNTEATRAIPVIMCTTRGEEDEVREGFESGCDDYVTKPLSRPELLSKVKSLLGS